MSFGGGFLSFVLFDRLPVFVVSAMSKTSSTSFTRWKFQSFRQVVLDLVEVSSRSLPAV